MSFRFIHTADLQIGKGFGQFPPDVGAALRSARLETLKRIAVLARDSDVDAVFIAGDVFDDIAVSDDTLRRFKVALEPFSGAWVLLPGNHDPAIAESPWSRLRRLSLPENIFIADQPSPIPIGDKAVVLPAPLRRRRDAADLTDWFDTAPKLNERIYIGLAHGSVREFLPGASEAANPVALDRAERAGLDYLALGDWHGRLKVGDRTWYAGTPEPDRFRSNDPGYILDVTIDGPGAVPAVSAIRVAAYEWIQTVINIAPGGAEDLQRGCVPEGVDPARLVLRINVTGSVDLATRAAIDGAAGDIRARVLHLEIDDADLTVEPTEDDLDQIDTAGFVRAAVNQLREQQPGTEGSTAKRALALLYGLQQTEGR
jgi:DNA repair exonuclease SbcCD nuclease subunit